MEAHFYALYLLDLYEKARIWRIKDLFFLVSQPRAKIKYGCQPCLKMLQRDHGKPLDFSLNQKNKVLSIFRRWATLRSTKNGLIE